MLATMHLEIEHSEQTLNYNASSLFHGIIMERVASTYANELHESQVNPFSQFVQAISPRRSVWHVRTLNEEAYENIILPLSQTNELYLRQRGQTIKITGTTIEKTSYSEMIASEYERTPRKIFRIQLHSPMTFKIKDEYQIFPDLYYIFRNLMNRFDAFSPEVQLYDQEALTHLREHTAIVEYKLRTTRFYLEKTTIPAMLGEMKVKVNGGTNMQHLVGLLLQYAQYSGIGIKTSLGMGGCEIIH
jgi:CRISPR-associated endoribonuclease Cas6